MALLSDLNNELVTLASLENSDGISSGDVDTYLTQALRQHDRFLTFDSLPIEEEEPVLTMAWAKICLVRASKFSKQANMNGVAGFGKDMNTPYQKCMSMAKDLLARYSLLCSNLRLDKERIVCGTLFTRDAIYDAMVPLLESVDAPRMILTISSGVVQQSDTSLTLKWVMDKVTDFYQVYVFSLASNTDTIFQEWNYTSGQGVPQINDSAVQLTVIMDFTQNRLKVINLDRTVQNRFLIVLRTRSNKYAYSNEVLLDTDLAPVVNPPVPSSATANVYTFVGSDANGNIVGSIGDLCVLIPSKEIQTKTSGMGTNTGWV